MLTGRYWRGFVLGLGWAALILLPSSGSAAGMKLVMFDEPECPYCAAWEREVGVIFEKTEEGRRLALERRDIADQGAVSGLAHPVRYTPTFVLMVDDAERGRIDGYPGEAHFWGLLGALLRQVRPVGPE